MYNPIGAKTIKDKSLCVCVCVCIYIYIYMYMYVCMYVCISTDNTRNWTKIKIYLKFSIFNQVFTHVTMTS